jgi:spermidine synthase
MVYLLFFCSGLSGLIYQVVWVRAFGNVFGNTIYSASLVVAVFMLGLGVGSYVFGRWADRRYGQRPESLLRAFGVVELTIGVLAILLSALLPHLGDLSSRVSSYTLGPDGWYVLSMWSHAARAAFAVGLLAPITVLMGGTLTLLVRHVVGSELLAGGWRIALLYAANTFGAAVGAFLTDFALVPAYGLQRTQVVAFGLNLVAGCGALYLARFGAVRLKPDTTYETKRRRPAVRSVRLQPDRPAVRSVRLQPDLRANQPDPMTRDTAVSWTSLAIACSGFAAMGMEIVWLRHFSILLGEYRAVFSLLVAVILCGIGAGALAGGWLHRRFGRPAMFWILAQVLFVVSTLAGLAAVDAQQIHDAAAGTLPLTGWARTRAELWFNIAPIILVAGCPSLMMGFAFPLANAVIQRLESTVGTRAGVLYFANTAGAVAGALAAGFLLLPGMGVQASTTLLAALATIAIAPLYLSLGSDAPSRWPVIGSLTAAAAALGAWLMLPSTYLLSRQLLFPLDKAYAVSEGLTEVIAVTDGPNGGRVLVTNGHPMSSTELFSQRYMRAMAHIPLLALGHPARVLVLCYGVGNTAHAAALHPTVERIDVVDLSAHVLRHSSYFADFNGDVLRDKRVAVYVNDGRHHLGMQPPGSYDLITLEPPPIEHAGVASLYSREFYQSARSRLSADGYITQWLPVFGISDETTLAMIRAFVEVFPNAVLLSGAYTNLLLIGTTASENIIDPDRVSAALSKTPMVRADLQRLDLGTLRELVGTFVAPAGTLVAATRGSAPVTDDRPIQEYGKKSLLDFGEGGIPPSIIAVNQVASWCPRCFSGGKPIPVVEDLETYLAVNALAYRVRGTPATFATGRTVAGSGYLGSFVPDSPELHQLLGSTPDRPDAVENAADTAVRERYARATALLEARRFAEAVLEFRAVLDAAPDSVQAMNNLGVALASLGRMDEAIDLFRRALTVNPGYAEAQRNLSFALKSKQ